MSLNIAFRVDASVQIGTGHVMRCLTLAEGLRLSGYRCFFICREHEGHLGAIIISKGFELHLLPAVEGISKESLDWVKHAVWLGTSWESDVDPCAEILKHQSVDWLVIDHYGLDWRWQEKVAPFVDKIMVIDDLADRHHRCDLLLDQTYGRLETDYRNLVPGHCKLLCGSMYALLRPEFSQWREYSLERRKKPALKRILVTMGGVDKDNATGKILEALKSCCLPVDCEITVVMGCTAPWLTKVKLLADTMPYPTSIKVDVNNMAEIMSNSDLAIGAAGATVWERCCLGLPTIMVVLADNQRFISSVLNENNIAVTLFEISPTSLMREINNIDFSQLIHGSSLICDGEGTYQVISYIEKIFYASE